MLQIRHAKDRGHFDHGWLDTWHTFSFSDYFDADHVSFRSLRVMNEDHVAPGQGFGMHPHRDMEIVTYVLDGQLRHQDSMGNGSIVAAGDLQRMTAGTGVMHSEFNPSATEAVHLYQIWLYPERKGLTPGYEQRSFTDGPHNRWQLVATRDGRDGALTIYQDIELQLARLDRGAALEYALRPGRHAWLQILRGEVRLGETGLVAGDGAAVSDEASLALAASGPSEVLLFDLP